MICANCKKKRPKKDLQHVTSCGWDFFVCVNQFPCVPPEVNNRRNDG